MLKKTGVLLLCVVLLCMASVAQASGLTITYAQDVQSEAAQEGSQFPFIAETGELAVSVRESASAKSDAVGRLERGERLTVLSGTANSSGEIWYEVELSDGMHGYVRSDLLMSAAQAQAERAANPAPETASASQVIGNKNSKKYHETWCHTLPKESNRVYFDSAAEAENKGYVHCKNCD